MRKRTGFEMQREFHQAFDHPIRDVPATPGAIDKFEVDLIERLATMIETTQHTLGVTRRGLRIKLLLEEVAEYLRGEANNDLVGIFDGLVDCCVIAEGTCLEYGLPFDEGRVEVHCSNMSKLGPGGKPIHRDDGKIMKGPDYQAPDLRGIIEAAIIESRQGYVNGTDPVGSAEGV